MKKPDIVKRMAREAGVTPAEAADRLDDVVRRLLSDLRQGRESAFPGLGRFHRGRDGKILFEPHIKDGRRD
jgi:nucleoid DNA-binding protein